MPGKNFFTFKKSTKKYVRFFFHKEKAQLASDNNKNNKFHDSFALICRDLKSAL